MASSTRRAAAASVRARCTTFSRPSAIDKMVRDNGNTKPRSKPRAALPPMRRALEAIQRARAFEEFNLSPALAFEALFVRLRAELGVQVSAPV